MLQSLKIFEMNLLLWIKYSFHLFYLQATMSSLPPTTARTLFIAFTLMQLAKTPCLGLEFLVSGWLFALALYKALRNPNYEATSITSRLQKATCKCYISYNM